MQHVGTIVCNGHHNQATQRHLAHCGLDKLEQMDRATNGPNHIIYMEIGVVIVQHIYVSSKNHTAAVKTTHSMQQ